MTHADLNSFPADLFQSVPTGIFPDNSLLTPFDNNLGQAINSDDIKDLISSLSIQSLDIGSELIAKNNQDVSILGAMGNDAIAGHYGHDLLLGAEGNDVLRGDLNSRKSGTAKGGDDLMFGGKGDDRLGGKGGNDWLLGGLGNDLIWGDDGHDVLFGGLGDDELTGDDFSGGLGNDIFVLTPGMGTDKITDFGNGEDRILLLDGLTFEQLTLTKEDGNTLIQLDDETLAIALDNTDLSETDFLVYEASASDAQERARIKADELPELASHDGRSPLVGFIDFAEQQHDRNTLEVFQSIPNLENQDYTLLHADNSDWAEKLTQFVDQVKNSEAPGAVVNLGFDLTQFDDLKHVTTRYELTSDEQEAIQYARDNNVILVVAAGNTGDKMSALGEAAQTFDNIVVVGAVGDEDEKADYAAQGPSLSLVAPGGEWADDPDEFVGTSRATVYGTALTALTWQANPDLNYQQVIAIGEQTADDLDDPGWDARTGFGLADVEESILLAQQTEGENLTSAAPIQINPFSGEGRVEPLARPASDADELAVTSDISVSENQLLEVSPTVQTDFWEEILGVNDAPDPSVGEYAFDALNQYQDLKAKVNILSEQERLLEEGLALIEQQIQVELNKTLTLQNEYQILDQELQALNFDKFVLENQVGIYEAFTNGQGSTLKQKLQNAGIDLGEGSRGEQLATRIIELERAIASEQLWLSKNSASSPTYSGVEAERDAYTYELQALQDLLTIDGVQKQQEIERINLEIAQKQQRISHIEPDLIESHANLTQLDLQLEAIPNELEGIRLAQEVGQENLRSLVDVAGSSLPYRERIDAIQRQVAYLEQRIDEVATADDSTQEALTKELEWAQANLSTLIAVDTSKTLDGELEQLIADLQNYQNTMGKSDLPASEYIDYLGEIRNGQRAFLESHTAITQRERLAKSTLQVAEQSLDTLWEDHVQLTADKAQLKQYLANPNLYILHPGIPQLYQHQLAQIETALDEKFEAIQLTERYIEQVKDFADKLENWHDFFTQVKEETIRHEQVGEQWKHLNQEQNTLAQNLLDSFIDTENLEVLLLDFEYLSAESELLKVVTQLENQKDLVQEFLDQDEQLKEQQLYYYNLYLQHKEKIWATGSYSESVAATARENHQEASLIADQRNKLWVQIQAASSLVDDIEDQKTEQETAIAEIKQDLINVGQDIPTYESNAELQTQLALVLEELDLFFAQLGDQLAALESTITNSQNQWANLQEAMQLRPEAAQKLIAFGLVASESDPDFFYSQVEPQVEAFINELEAQYQLLEVSKDELAQLLENLDGPMLNEAVGDVAFVAAHLEALEVWQGDITATVNDLRDQLNSAWDNLALLREQQDLDEKLQAPRPESVTLEAATAALEQDSIQGYAQLHDQVADDLVSAVKTWTQDLQASHQVTQDLIAAQNTQSQSVDDVIETMQEQLANPYGQYRLAKIDLRDIITTQQVLDDRSLSFEQAIEDNQDKIDKLELKITQNQKLWDELTQLSYAFPFSINPVEGLEDWSESRKKDYGERLRNAEAQRGILENKLDPQNPSSLHKRVDLQSSLMNIWWTASRNNRRNIGIDDDDSPYAPYWIITKKKKFIGITVSTSKENWTDWALLKWAEERDGKLRLESEIKQARKDLDSWKARESEYVKLEKQWTEADNAASQAEWQARQVRNTLEQLKTRTDYEIPELQSDLQQTQALLITLEQQAIEAQQEAQAIKSSLEQAWETYVDESQDYREATVGVLENQSEVDRQALQYRSMLAEVERWVEGQAIATDKELQQALAIKPELEAAIQSLQGKIASATPSELTDLTTKAAQLQESLALLLSKINVLETRQASLTQNRALVAASDAVIVAEEKLLQAYLVNPDQDTSTLEAELSAARAALAEAQRLAEQAEASSQALTQPLQNLQEELLARNDEHIQQARQQQQLLSELREATERNLNYTLKATEAQQKVNGIESQIIAQLQQAVDAGNQEAVSLLRVAETNDRAALAELYFKDYGDLASDKKFAKPEYRQLADQYYQEWQHLLGVKEQEQEQADHWRQLRQKAEAQLEVLEDEEAAAQAELDKWNAKIAETQEEIEAKEQAIAITQVRLASIEQLRAETEQTFVQLVSLEQLNLAQAQLEIQIGAKRDADIEQSIQDRLAREQEAIDRKRKVVLAQIEQLKQIQSEADLQQALNTIRGDLGMTDLEVVESPVQLQTQMADLLSQLDVLETEQPDLPDNLQALLTEVKGDIHLALQGEEAANIQTNLLAVADGMVVQIEQYKAELAQIDLESQQEAQLLQLAQSDLKVASEQFVEAAENNQALRDQIDELNIEYWVALEGIAYAEQQVEISEQWATQAREALDQIIKQRQEARKQRKKAFWNKLLSGISTVVGVLGAVASFIPGLNVVGLALVGVSAGINAIQSAVNGDWAGAVFGAVMGALNAVTAGASSGLLAISQAGIRAIQGVQAAASGLFNGIRSIKTGDGILGALQILGGAAGTAAVGLGNALNQASELTRKTVTPILNSLKQAPQLIYKGARAIQDGDWIGALDNLLNSAVDLGQNLASSFNSSASKILDSSLEYIKKGGGTFTNLASAIKEGGMNAWFSGLSNIGKLWKDDLKDLAKPLLDRIFDDKAQDGSDQKTAGKTQKENENQDDGQKDTIKLVDKSLDEIDQLMAELEEEIGELEEEVAELTQESIANLEQGLTNLDEDSSDQIYEASDIDSSGEEDNSLPEEQDNPLPEEHDLEAIDVPAIEPTEGQKYGSQFKSDTPPGLPEDSRLTSPRESALPYVEDVAEQQDLGDDFTKTVKHLAKTESGGQFARPANNFDARPPSQRPEGKGLITAWGTFQFNRDAWRSLSGVDEEDFPWDATPYEEISRPIQKYGELFSTVTENGGSSVDAARGVRLWHMRPNEYRRYVNTGKKEGFSKAWNNVDTARKSKIDRHLRNADVL